MYCPYCGTELTSDAVFCRRCGKPIKVDTPPVSAPETPPAQPHYEKSEVSQPSKTPSLNDLIQYFFQKQDVYDRYDTACAWINRLARGSSNALLIWGGIIYGLFLFVACIILSDAYNLQAALSDLLIAALILLLPGTLMIGGGIWKKVRHRHLLYRHLSEYVVLSRELHEHYRNCPSCPIVPECTNPRILVKLQNIVNSGQCATMQQALNTLFASSAHDGISQYQDVLMRKVSDVNWRNGLTFIFLPPKFFR